MGNFSRDTYKPAQGYAAVRLQQGVPLVDADWNEHADIARNELYGGLATVAGTVAVRNGLALSGTINNDLLLSAGQAVVGGRPINLTTVRQYTTQRYRDAALATKDGVVRPPDLTTPAAPRTDFVYLDVFEREVNSVEDTFLVNPAIGIETSVRVKREVVLRVAEGSATLPASAAGHQHLPIALLRRTASVAAINAGMIEDAKPYAELPGTRRLGIAPIFSLASDLALSSTYVSWLHAGWYDGTGKLRAVKPLSAAAWGVLALALPDGARLRRLRVRGTRATGATLNISLDRTPQAPSASTNDKLANVTLDGAAATTSYDTEIAIPADGKHIVDAANYGYFLQAWSYGTSQSCEIHGISLTYDP